MAATDTPLPTPTGGRDRDRAARRSGSDDPLLGTELDGFKLVRRLGKGGMGAVYLAEHTLIGSRVAIKILLDELATRSELVARFYAEARAVNLIGHENIVSIFDLKFAEPHRYYLVMEYLEGQPLSALARGPVAPEVAIPILMQCCDALDAAHARGIVHRDLKPENIFLTRRGGDPHFVKLLDFGVAKLFSEAARDPNANDITQAGTWVGTPRYMAPEQCATGPIDGRADIYAMGIIGYQLATGRPPFTEGGLVDVLVAHRDRIPPAPHAVNPSVPAAWSQVIMRAIAKKPKERFARASEMRTALAEALAAAVSSPPHAGLPSSPGFSFRGGTFTGMPSSPGAVSSSGAGVRASTPPQLAPVSSEPPVPAAFVGEPPAPGSEPSSHGAIDPAHASALEPLREGELPVRVFGANGQELFSASCRELSRGGVYLCVEVYEPPLHTRLKLTIDSPHGTLELPCEVVRQVTSDQAHQWNLPVGFGCQFVDLSPEQKSALQRVLLGVSVINDEAPQSDRDNSEARALLDSYASRLNADHYLLLGLMPDAPTELVQRRAFEVMQELLNVRTLTLSPRQSQQVEAILTRVTEARVCLGDPRRRAEYDGWHGNFRGVSACIDAGVSPDELAALRTRYLEEHEGLATRAALHTTIGKALADKGHLGKAVDEYETALSLDPFHYGLLIAWREAKAKRERQLGLH